MQSGLEIDDFIRLLVTQPGHRRADFAVAHTSVLLIQGTPNQLESLAGQEHSQIIPLANIGQSKNTAENRVRLSLLGSRP